jgi:hypothetical protein
MQILCENVDLDEINPKKLTCDCKFVRRANGTVDIVKEYSSVRIFDYYWDRGIKIEKIWLTGGTRNPKFEKPEL